MKRTLTILIIILSFVAGWVAKDHLGTNSAIDKITPIINRRPLEEYSIENLAKNSIPPGEIKIIETLDEEEEFTSYLFSFEFVPDLVGDTKTTTGQINIPEGEGPFPLVIMLRGYVDQEIYQTGVGTKRAAAFFAQNGFVTVSPDFLGYAGSDPQSKDIMKARFQTYTTALSLINSVQKIDGWDKENLFIWGHSNGGHIALTVLEVTGKNLPTTLWAPVTKPFPYSILYYTDEAEDRGKFLRRELAEFEKEYDADLYAIDLYLDRIKAPVQLHQGTDDDAIPVDWSNEFVEKLEELEIDIAYHIYPGADHNLNPSWDTVVNRDLSFFQSYMQK